MVLMDGIAANATIGSNLPDTVVQGRSKKYDARNLHNTVKTVMTHARNILARRATCWQWPIGNARNWSIPLATHLIDEVEWVLPVALCQQDKLRCHPLFNMNK